LVQPSRAVVAGIDHDGGSILRRDAGGCFGSSRPAGHFNTDQGSQFTGAAFTGVLANNDIAISMDGKGAWRDNVFVERLWRSVKYEEVHLRAYDSVGEARASIGRYLDFYNGRRPHSSLDGTTPDQAYFTPLPIRMAA
jgi:putative transposase